MNCTYIRVPLDQPQPTRCQKTKRYLMGSVLVPMHWLWAHRYHTPGLGFHWLCARFGLRLLFPKTPLSRGWAFTLGFMPMDSTRYFEFDALWRFLPSAPAGHYLDISSPRMFPLIILQRNRAARAELINPDRSDMGLTAQLVKASGLDGRCRLHNLRIDDASFELASFDLITSISVVEHIPDDIAAINKMWGLLKPGGRLLLTAPCRAKAAEQFINYNEYGLYEADESGFVFWQRYYDEAALQERILSVTTAPHHQLVYGEKIPGSFQQNAQVKRNNYFTTYPFWREPTMMGQAYRCYDRIADLPGEGVVALELIKT